MENFNHIHVFKTCIKSEEGKAKLKPVFDSLGEIESWHLDLEDCDKVLRIVSHKLCPGQIITHLKEHGVQCAELI